MLSRARVMEPRFMYSFACSRWRAESELSGFSSGRDPLSNPSSRAGSAEPLSFRLAVKKSMVFRFPSWAEISPE